MEHFEKMLKEIANMTNQEQETAFYLLEKQIGQEITDKLRERVFFIKLYTDKNFYNSVQSRMAVDLYETFTQ